MTDEIVEEMDEMGVEIGATKLQIEEFRRSIIWNDIKRELDKWKSGASQEYSRVIGDVISGGSGIENPDMYLGNLYGREATINFMLSLPNMFLEILKDKEDKSDGTGHE